VELVRRMNASADELVFLDISATSEKRKTFAQLVKQMPFMSTFRSPSVEVFIIEGRCPPPRLGSGQSSVNSAAVSNLVSSMSWQEPLARQCIVLAIDAGKSEQPVDRLHSRRDPGQQIKKLFSWQKKARTRRGEILLPVWTTMDKNGFAIDPWRSSTSFSIFRLLLRVSSHLQHF